MLKFNQNHKSIQIPFVIYATMEFLLEKTSSCDTDPTNLHTHIKIKQTLYLITAKQKLFLQRCRLYEKVLCKYERASDRNNQLWKIGNAVSDIEKEKITQQ